LLFEKKPRDGCGEAGKSSRGSEKKVNGRFGTQKRRPLGGRCSWTL